MLAEFLRASSTFHLRIILPGTDPNVAGMKILAAALRDSSITSLTLLRGYGEEGRRILVEVLQYLRDSSITSLKLRGEIFSTRIPAEALLACTSLTSLNLKTQEIPEEAMRALATLIRGNVLTSLVVQATLQAKLLQILGPALVSLILEFGMDQR